MLRAYPKAAMPHLSCARIHHRRSLLSQNDITSKFLFSLFFLDLPHLFVSGYKCFCFLCRKSAGPPPPGTAAIEWPEEEVIELFPDGPKPHKKTTATRKKNLYSLRHRLGLHKPSNFPFLLGPPIIEDDTWFVWSCLQLNINVVSVD